MESNVNKTVNDARMFESIEGFITDIYIKALALTIDFVSLVIHLHFDFATRANSYAKRNMTKYLHANLEDGAHPGFDVMKIGENAKMSE